MSELDATEAAIELAEQLGIEPESIVGTGKDGRILKQDVEDYVQGQVAGQTDPEEEDSGPDFHTIVRGISKSGRIVRSALGAYFPSDQVDAYIRSWLEEGYKVLSVDYLGEDQDGFRVMYVLVRE